MFQIKWVWKNLKGRRLLFVLGLVLSCLTSVAAIIVPKLSQIVIDNVIVGVKNAAGVVVHHVEMLVPLLIAMVAVQFVVQSLRYLMVVLLEKSSQHLVLTVRETLYDNLQRLDRHFYSHYRTGDLMTRMTGDLDLIRHFCAWISYNIVDSVTLFAATMIFFFTVSWQLSLCLLAMTPVIFVITYVFSKTIRPVYVELRERLSQLNTAAQENIEGNRVVKAFHREPYEIQKFREKNGEFRRMNLKAAYTWQKFFPFIEFTAQALSVVVLLPGGLLVMRGQLTFGDLAIFTSLTWAIAYPMRNLGMLLNDIQRFFASVDKIIELYYARPLIADRHDAADVKGPAAGEITFDHVSFSYGESPVLDDVSFTVRPGQTVGILGPTGAGKTTIANLIMRFADPTKGAVLLDGRDVHAYTLRSLREKVAMATQDVFLYSDTVEGNIAYNDVEMPMKQVLRYADSSCSEEFIKGMPEGYDTIIGERGVGLSGGQRQRLALARALAKQPQVLILDDTTSAVDMETERLIQQHLRALPFPCTKIIIAQRISSIRNADRILVVQNHRITESGTHEELVARNGYYAMIDRLQREGFEDEEGGGRDGEK